MTRRKRSLSGEERTLWATVARTAVPLRPEDVMPEPPPAPVAEPQSLQAELAKPIGAGAKIGKADKPAPPPPLHPIERRTLTRVARGTIEIDGRIDLHGLTQMDAHDRLRGFLVDAQARGAKLVIVITGKGKATGEDPFGMTERGVLRRRVPQWLAEPGLRGIVIGFEEAHRSHGGGGALYVRIRKKRTAHKAGPA
ncbi:DNA mismatch repair protein MutS [Kaistia sp. 32K]|uniref:Smr/MutS family protein n=1 Tax=Kaistia sp. 32K TaxID=2795690 RepID=UPI0019158C1B|nr:Smr/MutS family protein [Kaistia sp. 32K]BCP55801.1 DNA mismatch repair protein MutS [Kaistia sp. 32K]